MSKQVKCKKSGHMIADCDLSLIGCLHGECRVCPYLTDEQIKIEKVNYKLLQQYVENFGEDLKNPKLCLGEPNILKETIKNVVIKKPKQKK